ncbi:MAG: TetR/AcrR family transcriptional regulator [Planctomycetota bacterium]
METLTPKQREIRERERRILDVATPMIREHGMSAIKMDSIAQAMNLTRGTIYNHFPNKEEILMAMAGRAVARRMALFHFATTLADRPRWSCAAIGLAAEVYADHLPDDFAIEQMVRHDPVWQKTSPKRRTVLLDCEELCIQAIGSLIDAAIECGDLDGSTTTTIASLKQQITFGLWSLVYGGLVIEATSPSLVTSGIEEPRQAIRRNCNALLDQLDWRPHYKASEYNALVNRITPNLIVRANELQHEHFEGPSDLMLGAQTPNGGEKDHDS